MTAIDRLADELHALAVKAEALAGSVSRRHPHDRTALEVAAEVIPAGVELWASRASDGRWYWYVTMPAGWEPAPGAERGWTTNPDSLRRWTSRPVLSWEDAAVSPDTSADPRNTKANALVAGLAHLVASLVKPAPVEVSA